MPKYCLYIGLPIALVNVYLNLLSIMALRYNIPKLKIALQRAEKQFLANKDGLVNKSDGKSIKNDKKDESQEKEFDKTIEKLKDNK